MANEANDRLILELIESGRFTVNCETGLVYAPKSNTPGKPVGALNKKGYLRTSSYVSGKSLTLLVHRIVWISCNGIPLDSSHHVNHKNGIKHDNRIANLELITHKENMAHSKTLGLHKECGRKDGLRDATNGRFLGKKRAGRLLDGREWNEMPEVRD